MKITIKRNGWIIPGTDCGLINPENAIRLRISEIKKFRKKVHDSHNSFNYNIEVNGDFVYKYFDLESLNADFERIEAAIIEDDDEGRVF